MANRFADSSSSSCKYTQNVNGKTPLDKTFFKDYNKVLKQYTSFKGKGCDRYLSFSDADLNKKRKRRDRKAKCHNINLEKAKTFKTNNINFLKHKFFKTLKNVNNPASINKMSISNIKCNIQELETADGKELIV
jgi:hypothetical protein